MAPGLAGSEPAGECGERQDTEPRSQLRCDSVWATRYCKGTALGLRNLHGSHDTHSHLDGASPVNRGPIQSNYPVNKPILIPIMSKAQGIGQDTEMGKMWSLPEALGLVGIEQAELWSCVVSTITV